MSREQDSTTWVADIRHVRRRLCSLAMLGEPAATFTMLLPAMQRLTIDHTDQRPAMTHHEGTGRSSLTCHSDVR